MLPSPKDFCDGLNEEEPKVDPFALKPGGVFS